MKKISLIEKTRGLRAKRTRTKILKGKSDRPRLSVSKTNKHIFLQIIDDNKRATLASIHDRELKLKKKTGVETAKELGRMIAKKAIEKGIKEVVFDRGKFTYHGVVKQIAEGAREGGLIF